MSTVIYSSGICYLSACTDDTDDELVATVNLTHPTGIDHGWTIAPEPFAGGEPNPRPCETDPTPSAPLPMGRTAMARQVARRLGTSTAVTPTIHAPTPRRCHDPS